MPMRSALHQGVHRPGEDALLGRRRAGGRTRVDPGLQSADRLLGIELAIVDVDAELLLDEAQQLDPPKGVDAQVGRQAGVRTDRVGWHAVDLADQPGNRTRSGNGRGRSR